MTTPDIQMFVDRVHETGYCLIPGVIPEVKCQSLREHLLSVGEKLRREEIYASQQVSAVKGLLGVDQSVAEYLADERVLAILGQLLGDNLRISFCSLLTNEPGKERTDMHADWPFNQNNACHIPTPYPDLLMHTTALLMVSPFTKENGGTIVVPGSHQRTTNPTDKHAGIDSLAAQPDEQRITGPAGSLLLMDSRLWHAAPENRSSEPRVCVAIRYAPWWLNLEPLDPKSELRRQWVEERGLKENDQSRIPREAYARLPEKAKPLLRHWVES